MKKLVLPSATIAFLLAVLSELRAWNNNWRPNFISWNEAFSILAFALCLFIPVIVCALAIKKIKTRPQVFTPVVNICIGAVATILAALMLYFDDNQKFRNLLTAEFITGLLILSLTLFLSLSMVYYAFITRAVTAGKKKLSS